MFNNPLMFLIVTKERKRRGQKDSATLLPLTWVPFLFMPFVIVSRLPFETDHKEQEEKSLFVWLVGPLGK